MRFRTPILSVAAILLVALSAAAADSHRVELDDGSVLVGAVRRLAPSRNLVDTGKAVVEVVGDRIATVDGRPGVAALPASAGRLIETEHLVVVGDDSTAELWTHTRTENRGADVLVSVSWGVAPHELEMARSMTVVDGFGNLLVPRLVPDPDREGFWRVTVPLVVPVAPGGAVELSVRHRLPGATRAVADGFELRFDGDFPDDRLYTRTVRLPAGAEVARTEPAPLAEFEQNGAPYVVWRRYYPAGVRAPLTVVYRPAAERNRTK